MKDKHNCIELIIFMKVNRNSSYLTTVYKQIKIFIY